MSDWDKRVSDAAEKIIPKVYTSLERECLRGAFTAGANWAREDMEKRVEELRLATVDSIDILRQQCEALAESLEQVSAECKAHIQMLDEKGVLVAVTNVAKANQTLAQYKKFKEGG